MSGYFPILLAVNVACDVEVLEAKLIRIHQPTMNTKDNPQVLRHITAGSRQPRNPRSATRHRRPWAPTDPRFSSGEGYESYGAGSRLGYAVMGGLIYPRFVPIIELAHKRLKQSGRKTYCTLVNLADLERGAAWHKWCATVLDHVDGPVQAFLAADAGTKSTPSHEAADIASRVHKPLDVPISSTVSPEPLRAVWHTTVRNARTEFGRAGTLSCVLVTPVLKNARIHLYLR